MKYSHTHIHTPQEEEFERFFQLEALRKQCAENDTMTKKMEELKIQYFEEKDRADVCITYTHTHTYTYAHTYTLAHSHGMHLYTHPYTHTLIHSYTHTLIHSSTPPPQHPNTHTARANAIQGRNWFVSRVHC